MYRPERRSNDPFETLVELTAAAVSRRPPPEHIYEPVGIPLAVRFAAFLDNALLHREGAANEADAQEYEELHRYYY